MALGTLSSDLIKRMAIALGSTAAASELASNVAAGAADANQERWTTFAMIVATSTSTTVDFGSLAVGDKVIHIPAAAGTTVFEVVATAGTKPSAAVVGDVYMVMRSYLPAAAPVINL